jgi:hypothetical protein
VEVLETPEIVKDGEILKWKVRSPDGNQGFVTGTVPLDAFVSRVPTSEEDSA